MFKILIATFIMIKRISFEKNLYLSLYTLTNFYLKYVICFLISTHSKIKSNTSSSVKEQNTIFGIFELILLDKALTRILAHQIILLLSCNLCLISIKVSTQERPTIFCLSWVMLEVFQNFLNLLQSQFCLSGLCFMQEVNLSLSCTGKNIDL